MHSLYFTPQQRMQVIIMLRQEKKREPKYVALSHFIRKKGVFHVGLSSVSTWLDQFDAALFRSGICEALRCTSVVAVLGTFKCSTF
jgi:hypothetical protein